MSQKGADVKTFECGECDKVYKTYKGYTNHKCVPKESRTITQQCKGCKRIFKTLSGYENHACKGFSKPKKKDHVCELCNAKYKTENGLIKHKCKIRLRMEEYKQAEGRIGFVAYQHFYKRVLVRTNNQKPKTLLDFVNSSYYNGFYKFGKYVVNLNMPFYHEYIDFLITYNIPLDKWTNDQIYDTYIKTQNKKETSERAVEKTLNTMNSWSVRTGIQWKDYFRKEDNVKIMNAIRVGKVSPWVIYNSTSGQEFMQTLDTVDLNIIFGFIDPNFWGLKFDRHKKEQTAIVDIMKQYDV